MASHGMPRAAATEQKSLAALQKEKKEIEDYKALVELIEAKVAFKRCVSGRRFNIKQIAERQYTLEVLELTSKLLSKNPEYYTIWNVRRRLLIYGLFSKSSESSSQSAHPSSSTSVHGESSTPGAKSSSSTLNTSTTSNTTQPDPKSPNHGKIGTVHELIQADLDFIFPLMVGWPKCYWIWNYRLWLLKQANERLEAQVARRLWERELVLVGKMLTRDSRNFHGWGYRRTVVSQLESPELNGSSMIESEFEYTTRMITRELKNFSAWHNRSKLIPRLLDERKATDAERRQFLDDDCKWVYNALLEYTLAVCEMEERLPGHDEVEDCKAWLSQLRKLDPMREGRWNDLEKSLKSSRVLSEEQH
ncbi:hypothetical protein CJF32_00009024 [Rutstroemia sp. NJR-2017a WRK4]|nr:hypothetical protein CJF32_00009024 [Rutstroemia sp. NJR-2017a WRK4]